MPFSETSVLEMTAFGRSASGQQVLNVFHYRQETLAPQLYDNVDLQEAVSDFSATWVSVILPLLSTDYTLEKARGRALTGTIANPTPPPPNIFVIGEQFELIAAPGTVGARGGEVMTSFNAFGVQKLSDRAGRNFRGSFRLGTISTADVQDNIITPAFKPTVDTATQTFVTTDLTLVFDAVDWNMAVFSRTLALAAPPPFTDLRALTARVTGARVNNFITSQVSRKQSLTSPT